MDIALDIAIQSHLSDAVIETQIDLAKVRKRIRFVKTLILLKDNKGIKSMSEEKLNKLWDETSNEEEL